MYQYRNKKSGRSSGAAVSELTELIGRLRQPGTNPGQFLADLLAAQCLLGQAEGGAVLRPGKNSDIEVLALYPSVNKGVAAPEWLTASIGFARDAFSSDSVLVRSLDGSADHAAEYHVVMVPLNITGLGAAIAAFVTEADSKNTIEIQSKRMELLSGLLSNYHTRPGQQNWQESCRRLQRAIEVLSSINQQNKFTSAAMTFCNEIASQWKCERVSIGFLKGRYVQLKAMSHTESFSRKMQIVQDIEAAMEECLDQDIEILSPAPKEAMYVSRATEKLSDRYGPLNILSFPLRRSGETLAVVTLERPANSAFSSEDAETVRLACELCTPRISNLYENDRWLGATVAVRVRKLIAGLVGPKHTWAKVIAILCFAAILFLIFGKGQFRAKAPFVLEATYQQVVPAPFDGYLRNVEVEIGDLVEGGSSILASLDTAELRLQLAATKAEKAGYIKQASAAMRDGETAQAQIAQADADKTQAEIELLEYQIGQASLISPLSGIVVKGDLKRETGAPVKIGDILFEVCPLDSLRAQLMVPEDEVHDIKVGQEGYMATASYPGERVRFVVERINPVAEVVNQRNVFKVRVQLRATYLWMRPGMEGVAKVEIGKRHYAWIWTRKIVNWIRMQLWF